jgi:hypothetical protein
MTGQGWMVDDGTCDACWKGDCLWCAKPQEVATDDHGILLVCCCDEAYRIGYAYVDEDGPP